MKWLINRPPLSYLTAYILTILGFAAGYTFMPNNFYQNTQHLEKYASANGENEDELKKAILLELKENMKKRFLQKNEGDLVRVFGDSIFFHADDISATDIAIQGNEIIFTISGVYYLYQSPRTGYAKLSTNLQSNLIRGFERFDSFKYFTIIESSQPFFPSLLSDSYALIFDTSTFYPDCSTPESGQETPNINVYDTSLAKSGGNGTIPHDAKNTSYLAPKTKILRFVQSNVPIENKEKNLKSVFTNEIRKDKLVIFYYRNSAYSTKEERRTSLLIPISANLTLNLRSYALGLTNSPVENQDRLNLFIKMLYFSTITIATLGYGDIVPITTLARSLTALEVILGVLIIGLFLNSLAQRIRVKSN